MVAEILGWEWGRDGHGSLFWTRIRPDSQASDPWPDPTRQNCLQFDPRPDPTRLHANAMRYITDYIFTI